MELGKLFIGGISWGTNEDRLREYFQTFGEVVEAVIMKDRATGRARGFGFVVFADPAVAERVVMKEHMIDGRTVEAKKAVPRDDQNMLNKNNISTLGSPGPSRTKKIFVGGLASTVTESDFKRYFDQFGTITDVVVMYDHNTQRPRGFGFITYDSEEAVDKVLQRTFHELNEKMVEVKRAVPKESSLGPNRNQLGGYNFGLSRVNSFLNGYMQGYNTNSVGGYGVRMEGRSSPGTIGHNGFSPLSHGYGMGLNFESNLSPSSGWKSNLGSNLSHGRGFNTSFNGNSNRFASPFGYGVGSGGNDSVLNSAGRNVWGNGSLNYATNPTNSSAMLGPGSGKTEAVDKVLQRTFHELNEKMVEVKRAVPKESSLGPNRNQLGGYNFGLSRVNSFLNGYMQGYNTNSVGGYGVRMEGRSSPGTIGHNGFSPLSHGYGMGLNFESNLSPSSGWKSNLGSNLSHGRGFNTSFNGNSNRFASPFGYGVGSGGNDSVLNSAGRNVWGNGSLNYATNPTNSSAMLGPGSGKTGVSSLGSIGPLWDSSPKSGQGGGVASAYNSSNLRYGSGDFGIASGGIGHGRSSGTSVAQVSSHGGYDRAYADIYDNGSFFEDSTWQSSPLDLEQSSSFDFGLGNTTSDVMSNNSAGYIGGYNVTNRQSNGEHHQQM
ncbi:hypothetical protein GOBAR_AA24848 [Gossypium barbadense]|uniref:RRM domain-containing protein n=1 Tax=Gossypium barbadense TaxID=3634 RepID=A0A2P5WXM9_GOSBA|nr:hypothetical protein GOBAR_AA24848 [Gossypium barbadense]